MVGLYLGYSSIGEGLLPTGLNPFRFLRYIRKKVITLLCCVCMSNKAELDEAGIAGAGQAEKSKE